MRNIPLAEVDQAPRAVLPIATDYAPGQVLDWHEHRRAQFLYGATGVMIVDTGDGTWTVPADRAVLIPSATRHRVRMQDVSTRSLYIEPRAVPWWPRDCAVVDVTALLRELLLAAADLEADYDLAGREGAVAALLLHEIAALAPIPLHVALPRTPDLADLCRGYLADPDTQVTNDDWARQLAMSERSFTRRFHAELGISPAAWRTRARLLAAVPLLRELTVTEVSGRLGYSSPAAFTAAFSRTFGLAPSSLARGSAAITSARGGAAFPDEDEQNRGPGQDEAPGGDPETSELLRRLDAAAALVNPCMVRLPRAPGAAAGADGDVPFAGRDEAIAWLDAGHANLLALADDQADGGDVAVSWTVLDALRGYHDERGWNPEWVRLTGTALDTAVNAGDVRAQAALHLALAKSSFAAGDYTGSHEHGRRALDLSLASDWRDGEAAAYHNLAAAALVRGDTARSGRYLSLWSALNAELGEADAPGLPSQTRVPDWTALTDREQAIARLVVRGLTNQQIATRAGCSAETVKFHLRNIFRKLGIRSRTEVAGFVLTARGRS